MGFRLQQKSMALNDLERGCNGRLLSVVLTNKPMMIADDYRRYAVGPAVRLFYTLA